MKKRTKTEKQTNKLQQQKTEQNIQGLWENYKRYNINVMEIPEDKKKHTEINQ